MSLKKYRLSTAIAAPSADSPFWQLNTVSKDVTVREISITLSTAVATRIGLILALTTGVVTAGSDQKAVSQRNVNDPASNSVWKAEWAWGTPPTHAVLAADQYWMGRLSLPGSVGATVSWTFPPAASWQLDADSGLLLPSGTGLLLWNLGVGAGAAMDVLVVAEDR